FYFGAIIVFLFVLGMMIIRSPHKWWILGVSVLAFLMSTGKHFPSFNYFLFDTLPGFNKFRVPNMILVIPQLLFPLLAVWTLHDIIQEKISKEELWKKIKTAGIATGGLCLLLGLGSSIFFDFKSHRDPQLKEQLVQSFRNEEAAAKVMSAVVSDRADMAMKSGITSAVYIALAIGLLWAFANNKIKGQYAVLGIAVLTFIDLVRIDSRYLNEENYIDPEQYEAQFTPRPVDRQINEDPDPYYRVLDLSVDPFNNAMQAAHHKCIGGYSPAKMEIYQDLIDVHMRNGFNREVLNMLNTKYIISPQGAQGQPVPIPNPEACGNAWFVDNIQWEATADAEMLALKAGNIGEQPDTLQQEFNPKQTVVLRDTYKDNLNNFNPEKDSAAYVKLAEYGLNDISYVSNNSKDGFAVFSDIYYPYGWKAYIDGEETPIYRANYLLRALKIPAGEHKIEFKFHPEKFYTGDKIAMVSSLLLILAAAGSIFMAVRGGKKVV
ncbi:MAG TPA: YfhO family protein, partial [Flavipsychrobacter sp.]